MDWSRLGEALFWGAFEGAIMAALLYGAWWPTPWAIVCGFGSGLVVAVLILKRVRINAE